MPIGRYFGGHGSDVLSAMKKKNGEEGGTREFYATANAKNQTPPEDNSRRQTVGKRLAQIGRSR